MAVITLTSSPLYYNTQQSQNFQKQGCGADYTGSTVAYTVNANKYTSIISIADANQKALNEIGIYGQGFANANGTCIQTTFWNTIQSQQFTRNNCPIGYNPGNYTYVVPVHTYSAGNQTAANQLALDDIAANGQAAANNMATCTQVVFPFKWIPNPAVAYCEETLETFLSVQKSGSFTRNNCPEGQAGGTVTYTVPGGTYSSTISQADADNKAQADVDANGQNYANINASCTAILVGNDPLSGTYTRNNCGVGYVGGTVTDSIPANNFYASTKAAANAAAQAQLDTNGQNKANTEGTCTYVFVGNVERSQQFTRNNCPEGQTGGIVTYTVPANTYYRATVGEANAAADAQIAANGQSYANTNGACNIVPPATLTYNFNKSANPTVDIILVPVDNGSNLGNVYGTSSGSFGNIVAGHTVYIGLAHDVDNIPWPAESKANLVITKNGAPFYDSGDVTNPAVNDLAHVSFIAESGAAYAINAVSSSTSTAYYPLSLDMVNNSDLPLASGSFRPFLVTIKDHTDGSLCLKTGQEINPQMGVGFNALNDPNYLDINIAIASPVNQPVDITISNIYGYSQTVYNVLNNTSVDIPSVPKTSLNITYINNNGTPSIFYSEYQSRNFTKNNCPEGQVGSDYLFYLENGAMNSTVSIADANQKAIDFINMYGQNEANAEGTCSGTPTGTLIANKTLTTLEYGTVYNGTSNKSYKLKISLIDLGSSYGNHTLEYTQDYISSGVIPPANIFYYPVSDPNYITLQMYKASIGGEVGDGYAACGADVNRIFTDFPGISQFTFKIELTQVGGSTENRTDNLQAVDNSKFSYGFTYKINSSLPFSRENIVGLYRSSNVTVTITVVKTGTPGVYNIYYYTT